MVRSIGLAEPKASRHPRLDDDDSPVFGEGHDDPLATPRHADDRRASAESRQLIDRASMHERCVSNLEPAHAAPLERGP
jgi:hypothetical protein